MNPQPGIVGDRRTDDLQPPPVPGNDRDPATVDQATAYPPGQHVWVWKSVLGGWPPGEVQGVAAFAVRVRLQPTQQCGELSDRVTLADVAPRRVVGSR